MYVSRIGLVLSSIFLILTLYDFFTENSSVDLCDYDFSVLVEINGSSPLIMNGLLMWYCI